MCYYRSIFSCHSFNHSCLLWYGDENIRLAPCSYLWINNWVSEWLFPKNVRPFSTSLIFAVYLKENDVFYNKKNMRCVVFSFVWSVLTENYVIFEVKCWTVIEKLWLTFSNLSVKQLRDGLKFVFSLDIILSGWLGSKRQLTN